MSGDADLHVIIIRRIGLISLHRHRRQTANRQYEPLCCWSEQQYYIIEQAADKPILALSFVLFGLGIQQ